MTDLFADRCFDIFTDIDSSELPDAAYWLQVRLVDREHPEHGQAVLVLRRLLEWVSADPRTEQKNVWFRDNEGREWYSDAETRRRVQGNLSHRVDDSRQWNSDMAAMRDEAALSRYGW